LIIIPLFEALLIPVVAMLLLPLFGLFAGRKAGEESAHGASE